MADNSKDDIASQLNQMQQSGATPGVMNNTAMTAGFDMKTDFAVSSTGEVQSLPNTFDNNKSELHEVPEERPILISGQSAVVQGEIPELKISTASINGDEFQVVPNISDAKVSYTSTSTSETFEVPANVPVSPEIASLADTDILPSTPTRTEVVQSQPSTGVTDPEPSTTVAQTQPSTGVSEQQTTNVAREQTSSGVTDQTQPSGVAREQTSSGVTDQAQTPSVPRSQAATGVSEQQTTNVAREQTSSGVTDQAQAPTVTREQQSSNVSDPVNVGVVGKEQSFVDSAQEAVSYPVPPSPIIVTRSIAEPITRGDEASTESTPENIKSQSTVSEPANAITQTLYEKTISTPAPVELPEGVVAQSYPVRDQQSTGETSAETPSLTSKAMQGVYEEPYSGGTNAEGPLPVSYDKVNAEVSKTDGASSNAENPFLAAGGENYRYPEDNANTGVNDAKQSNEREAVIASSSDWRFRISLADGGYMYNAPSAGILEPLKATKGVIFPYVPNITVTHTANYDKYDLIHTNYALYNYKNSTVDQINITADFTAQDRKEAQYVLAVIHFFKSATKMFYGNDSLKGFPPPICFLDGFGEYNFNKHPVLLNSFTYTYKNDVDFIEVSGPTAAGSQEEPKPKRSLSVSEIRMASGSIKLGRGGVKQNTNTVSTSNTSGGIPTRIPTKLEITLTCYPVVSRQNISNNFSMKDYASGELLKGRTNTFGGGFW